MLEDFAVAAIKIGMLGTPEIVGAVAGALAARASAVRRSGERPSCDEPGRRMRAFIVYDPVMVASSGDPLSGAGFVEAIKKDLLPLVDCLTPNLAEAAALVGEPIAGSEAEMARQGRAALALGPRAVLMKGGHLEGEEAVDLLVAADRTKRFAAAKIASRNLHGTGCVLSSAIAAHVALGLPLIEAVPAAKAFVARAIEAGRDARARRGSGSVGAARARFAGRPMIRRPARRRSGTWPSSLAARGSRWNPRPGASRAKRRFASFARHGRLQRQ